MYLLNTMDNFTLRYDEWQAFRYHPNDLYLMGRPQIYHEWRLRPSQIRQTQVVLMHSFIKIWKFQFTPSIIGAWAQRLNPRPADGLSHLRPGGGEVKWPHLTQKLREIGRPGKSVIALNEYFRKYLSLFFAQVTIEVTRGNQRSNLAEAQIMSSHMCHYLRTYYRQEATGKVLDSSFTALLLACHQNWPSFNRLDCRGQERSK